MELTVSSRFSAHRAVVLVLLLAAAVGCASRNEPVGGPNLAGPSPRAAGRFVRQIPWAERGYWIKADTHIHTEFSDGSHRVDEVVERAVHFGCDVIAITDHADRNLTAATPRYFAEIQAARERFPDRIILAGLEWNVPPWNGREHAVVLFPPQLDESQSASQFKAHFDDLEREPHVTALAAEGLRWLAEQSADGSYPLVIYEHPHRKRQDLDEFAQEYAWLRSGSDRLVGFAGAPGHQRASQIGAYAGPITPRDRWDPACADLDGAWNTLLQQGLDVWAALAPSDFHDTDKDFWPGEFSETWLYVGERSAGGALRALESGSFFAAHGHLAREVTLRAHVDGLERPVYSGEVIEIPAGTFVRIEIDCKTPPIDWKKRPNRIDEIELIIIQSAGDPVVVKRPPQPYGPAFVEKLRVESGIALRARGRRLMQDGHDLMFYTNPIRIITTAEHRSDSNSP